MGVKKRVKRIWLLARLFGKYWKVLVHLARLTAWPLHVFYHNWFIDQKIVEHVQKGTKRTPRTKTTFNRSFHWWFCFWTMNSMHEFLLFSLRFVLDFLALQQRSCSIKIKLQRQKIAGHHSFKCVCVFVPNNCVHTIVVCWCIDDDGCLRPKDGRLDFLWWILRGHEVQCIPLNTFTATLMHLHKSPS